MSLTVLVSVSLLALVSSARSVPRRESNDVDISLSEPEVIRNAVKAVLRSHTGEIAGSELEECLECRRGFQVHLTSVGEQQKYLGGLSDDAVKAIVPLHQADFHTTDEEILYDILHRLESEAGRRTPVPDDMLDEFVAKAEENLWMNTAPSKESSAHEGDRSTTDATTRISQAGSSSTMIVVVALCCLTSLLALLAVSVVLYTTEVLRGTLYRSLASWDILPRLERLGRNDGQGRGGGSSSGTAGDGGLLCEKIHTDEGVHPVNGAIVSEKGPLLVIEEDSRDADSAIDGDEKFYDFESDSSAYSTPQLNFEDLPRTRPSTPSLGPSPMSTNNTQPAPIMCQVPTAQADARPAWSLRASESQRIHVEPNAPQHQLAFAAPPAAVTSTAEPGARRARAFAAVPGLDAALAMQLRPGLGVGADAAWLVRFVMALLGWCSVLISGRRDV